MTVDFRSLARASVRDLAPYVPGKPVDELQRELGLEKVIKLASNENPLGASPAVSEALTHVWADVSRYPDGNGFRLKQALSEYYGLSADMLTLGNGSNEVLELIARAFVGTEDEVIFSEHAFAVYPLVTQAIGARAVVVPAVDFGHDLEGMAAAVTDRTRVIFVANPNNPTGTWLKHSEVVRFLDAVPEQVIVVLDEAYFEYVEASDYPNGIELQKQYPNLIVTRTFSKIYGLASLRVGFGVADPVVTDMLNRVREPFNVNHYAQVAAVAALGDADFVRKSRELNTTGLQQLEQGLRELELRVIPSVGNFISFQVENADTVYQQLLRHGVIVRPIENYGIAGGLRATVGTQAENRAFLKAMRDVLGGQ